MEWKDYLNLILSNKTDFDDIVINYDNINVLISPIVKASILMLKEINESQVNNIFVFPEIRYFSLEFLLGEVISEISSGNIGMTYDPHMFEKGQKLSYADCVVVFDGCSEKTVNNVTQEYITITFKDNASFSVPMRLAPYFQAVESKRVAKLSTFLKKYKEKKKEQEKEVAEQEQALCRRLVNHKTHLEGTVVYVSEIKRTKDFLLGASLNDKKLSDLFYLAHINGNGEISNIAAGQMSGNPAIAITSDLYSLLNATEKLTIKSVIFDASASNSIDGQLDAFDEIMRKGIPVTVITDTANSFDNKLLTDRDFNEWRWDKTSITDDLYSDPSQRADIRVKNCAKQEIKYALINEQTISETFSLLYKQKDNIQEQSSNAITIYEKLFALAFILLRNTIKLDGSSATHYLDVLKDCEARLEKEKRFISSELSENIEKIIENIRGAVISNENKKYDYVSELFKSKKYESACLVISDKQDKVSTKLFWQEWNRKNNYPISLSVMYPQEYKENTRGAFDITVVAGWLNNKLMKNIIYHFESENYLVLLYPYEEKWKNAHVKGWKKSLETLGNESVIKKHFTKKENPIDLDRFHLTSVSMPDRNETAKDELTDIEQMLLSNRYRQYGSGSSNSDALVDAIPLSFVGGYLSFYRAGHKVITVTEIIQQTGNDMKLKLAEELTLGDFIVVREAEKDIIRDLADKLLESEGKEKVRDIAHKWKETLEVELLFTSIESFYEKLHAVGCNKDIVTVKNWITNDELITPQNKDDLLFIAKAANDEVLQEKTDIIFAAGKEVKSAHIKAGRILSERLKNSIRSELSEMEDIDPFNVWDPIQLKLDDIGNIKILKIIDIGPKVPVESVNTNRLLSE